jgi:hypothetical protein
MKNNRKTTVLARAELNPLTNRILTQMGPKGRAIQTRLKTFLTRAMSAHLEIGGKPDDLDPVFSASGMESQAIKE